MTAPSYRGYRFPVDVIQRAVSMYLRFTLSYRDVEDLLAERGIQVSCETIRRWVRVFGPGIARRLRDRRPRPHGRWLPVRRREWKLQGFKSPGSAQRFLSMHAATYNIFTIPRHLTSARTHRLFRAETFSVWCDAAGVAA